MKPEQPLNAEISNRIGALYREHYGRGPDRVKTYIHDDSIICVLQGRATRFEQTLVQTGKEEMLSAVRSAFQEAVAGPFSAQIEAITGHTVEAYVSGHRQEPDVSVEVFLLEKPGQQPTCDAGSRQR